jgi:hypothetical protein
MCSAFIPTSFLQSVLQFNRYFEGLKANENYLDIHFNGITPDPLLMSIMNDGSMLKNILHGMKEDIQYLPPYYKFRKIDEPLSTLLLGMASTFEKWQTRYKDYAKDILNNRNKIKKYPEEGENSLDFDRQTLYQLLECLYQEYTKRIEGETIIHLVLRKQSNLPSSVQNENQTIIINTSISLAFLLGSIGVDYYCFNHLAHLSDQSSLIKQPQLYIGIVSTALVFLVLIYGIFHLTRASKKSAETLQSPSDDRAQKNP